MGKDSQHETRLHCARCALEGLSVGDALGGYSEFISPGALERRIETRWLPEAPWKYTDDTNMALSIFAVLRRSCGIDQDALAASFVERYERGRKSRPGTRHLLRLIREGKPWREASEDMFVGRGSYGNGSAMRVPPVGAYFADDLDAVVEHARRSSEVTHIHPEGIAGAVAVAVAAAMAHRLQGQPLPTRADFIDSILPYLPDSEVRDASVHARELPDGTTVAGAAAALGNGTRVSCQDTVPFVLWCAGESLADYEKAIWFTLGGGGDTDTTCAMVGGIVVMYTGVADIPETWRQSREPLPDWPFTG
ncbi:MAG: ADP-ribosylglycohydrolase family protein [Anaerolineae bacterium]|nr:ADP-ribosylglycohydrolase family protein [Anaerolineae bacterium]